MKKYLLLLLVIFGSTSPISCKNIFWSLVGPVRSIDGLVEHRLKLWHEKRDGKYFWPDDETNNHFFNEDGFIGKYLPYEGTFGSVRKLFPENDSTSVDRLAKAVILAKQCRLKKINIAAQGINGPNEVYSLDLDYECQWKDQPKNDRFWWTIRYRRPYTYFASLGKWGVEGAVVAGIVYGVYKFVQKQRAKIAQIKNQPNDIL